MFFIVTSFFCFDHWRDYWHCQNPYDNYIGCRWYDLRLN